MLRMLSMWSFASVNLFYQAYGSIISANLLYCEANGLLHKIYHLSIRHRYHRLEVG